MKELYDNSIGYLRAICSRYISDDEDVKDVLQESFLKIFSSINGFEYRGEGSLRAWTARIVINESLKKIRAGRKQDEISIVDPVPDIVDEGDRPSVADIPGEELMRMIRSLPEGYRTVFNLFVFEGKSHREIAELLGIKENSSASQYHRARSMLARMIKEYNNRRGL